MGGQSPPSSVPKLFQPFRYHRQFHKPGTAIGGPEMFPPLVSLNDEIGLVKEKGRKRYPEEPVNGTEGQCLILEQLPYMLQAFCCLPATLWRKTTPLRCIASPMERGMW